MLLTKKCVTPEDELNVVEQTLLKCVLHGKKYVNILHLIKKIGKTRGKCGTPNFVQGYYSEENKKLLLGYF